MSTRAMITFYKKPSDKLSQFEGGLFKNCDGYPSGTNGILNILIPALFMYMKFRKKNDIGNAISTVTYFFKKQQFDMYKKWYDKNMGGMGEKEKGIPFSDSIYMEVAITGLEICKAKVFRDSLDFIYRIDLFKKQVKVYKVLRKAQGVQLVYTVPFNAEPVRGFTKNWLNINCKSVDKFTFNR